MKDSQGSVSSKVAKPYSTGIQVFTSLYALLYVVFFVFSFIPSPEGSPIADHPYVPWDFEMITVKLLFLLFMIGFYYSWSSRIISGWIYLGWVGSVVWQSIYVSRLLHVSGDGILFGAPMLFVAILQLIGGWRRRR